MKRWLACSLAGTVAAFSVVSLSIAGCGGSTGNGSDSGPPETSKVDHHMAPVDGGKPDHKPPPMDGGNDVAPFDSPLVETGGEGGAPVPIPAEGGPAAPTGGTQLVNAVTAGFTDVGSMALVGITDDNYVIYSGNNGTKIPIMAVPLAGGAPITILADIGATGYGPNIDHDTVFMWTAGTANATTGNVVGTLQFWTHAKGIQSPTGASAVGLTAASQDGTKVVYTTNVSADGTTGDLVLANNDLTGKTTLITGTTTNVTATTTYYNPSIRFANDTYFVASHQDGTSPVTVSFWDVTASTPAKKDLVTGAATKTVAGPGTAVLISGDEWSASTTGAGFGGTILAATSAGALQAFVLPSTTAVPIDTSVTSSIVKPDGSGVLYGTSTGAYKLATLPTPGTPTQILSTKYGGFIIFSVNNASGSLGETPAFSPDGMYSTFYTIAGTSPAGASDVNLVNNVAAATAKNLLSAPTGAIFGDPYTLDSKFALYVTNFAANGTGTLTGYPVGGSAAKIISSNNGFSCNALQLSAGSKVVYSDNWVAVGTANGLNDLSTVDLTASTLAPVSIVKQSDTTLFASYFLSQDRTKIVFSMMIAGNVKTAGIWSVPLP